MSKVNPAALAFADIPWRTASALITRDIHGRRAALRNNEHLVREGVLCAEILGSMDAATFFESLSDGERLLLATSIFHRHRAACYDIEKRPRVIVPDGHLARRKAYCSKGYRGRTVQELRVRNGADRNDDRDPRSYRPDQAAFPRRAQVPVLYPPLDARRSGCRIET